MAMRAEDDPWLTEREAAIELRVSAGTVRKERMEGALGHSRVRGRVFYPLSCIKAYKAAQTRAAGGEACGITSSSSEAAPLAGTSPGPKGAAAAAHRQVQRIMTRLGKSSTSSH